MSRLLKQDADRLQRRVLPLSLGVVVLFFILLTRLWYLQLIDAKKLGEMSENNRLRFVPVAASRGTILDRNGKVLVSNNPSFSVAVVPQDVKDRPGLVAELTRILDLEPGEIDAKWDKFRWRAKYYPIVIAAGISRDQLEYLEENRLRLPGVTVEMKPIRSYVSGKMAAHLLGYIGEISEDELSRDVFANYNPGDYVGKSGVERSWEDDLHGDDGGKQIEVDARGRFLRTITESVPKVGNSAVLTIDAELQKRTEEAFGDKAGAAVLMEVNSGEILAFASNPGFDPALFTGRMSPEQWQSYLDDKRHPLENKALKGQYPPGSTYKIITALAGLEEGVISDQTTVQCTGSHTVGTDTFRCWDKKGHGTVNLKRALRESCDVYFYILGEKIGVDKIAAYARKFGLGEPLKVGLENEKGGNIPDAAWKKKKFGKPWYRGETLPVAIGQGYTLLTPIQLTAMIAATATNGQLYRPHLVKKIIDPDGKLIREFKPEVIASIDIKPASFRAVKEGLLAVVNEPKGTGAAARLYEVKVAGKTGTSQVVKQRDKKGDVPYQYRDHALFVAFAPYEAPEVAVAVVIEHGEHGGAAAAPIAGAILRKYFEQKGVIKRPVRPDEDDEDEGKTTATPEEGGARQ